MHVVPTLECCASFLVVWGATSLGRGLTKPFSSATTCGRTLHNPLRHGCSQRGNSLDDCCKQQSTIAPRTSL
eukprot:6475822-Amphidinium_carterae.2